MLYTWNVYNTVNQLYLNFLKNNKEYFIHLFLATLHSLWDLSSQTSDQTQALSSEGVES